MAESGISTDSQVSVRQMMQQLVGDVRPQFAEFVVKRLNLSQQNGREWRSKGMASQSDEDTSSLPSFSAVFPSPWLCGPDQGHCCGVCKQSAGTQSPVPDVQRRSQFLKVSL